MAIPEACALWIEQQIDDELKEKEVTEKSLRAIGRDIATEIERVFKAKVKPRTIEKKAERMVAATNVAPSQNTPPAPEKKETSPAPLCKKCGARRVKISRGKPPSHGLCQPCRKEELKTASIPVSDPDNKSKETENNINAISDALHFAIIAISQLERIRADDPDRIMALNRVSDWIIANKGKGAK